MEIKICPTCLGRGSVSTRERITNLTDSIVCPTCNDTGRVMVSTYAIQVPFDFNRGKVSNADKQIHDIILDLKK